MIYRSWTRLTDRVYMLGALSEKEKPRPFVVDLLKEGERELIKQGCLIEGIYHIHGGNVPSRSSETTREYLLPDYVGIIKSVQVDGNLLQRFNSDEMELDNTNQFGDGADSLPTGWNMAGSKRLVLNQKLAKGSVCSVFYESTEPMDNLVLKSYLFKHSAEAGEDLLYVEPHYDVEHETFWNGKTVHFKPVSDSVETFEDFQIVIGSGQSSLRNGAIMPGETGDLTATTKDLSQSAGVNVGVTQYYQGSYQKMKGTSTKGADSIVDNIVYPNYRTLYGPTCKAEFQDILPYYALSVMLQSGDAQLAGFFNDKFYEQISNITDRRLDNDLDHKIKTETRNSYTWGT